MVSAGDVVVVHAGTYAGFVLTRSGTQADPIVFRGAAGEARPVVDGAVDGRADVIKISGAHDIRVTGFVVRGANGGDFSGSGLRTENSATRIEIDDNVFTNNHCFGVNSATSTYVSIHDNDISHDAVGVQISYGGEGSQIMNNVVHDTDQMLRNTTAPGDDAGGAGIAFVKSTGHVTASGNTLSKNRAASHDYGTDGSAFEVYGASNVTMTDNVMFDSDNVLESGTDPGLACTNNVFARNTAYGANSTGHTWGMFLRCGANMLIANNTFVDLDAFVFAIGTSSAQYSGNIDGMRIENNIVSLNGTGAKVFGITSALPASVRIDYNLAWTSGTLASLPDGRSTRDAATFSSWTGYQVHGTGGNPDFMDLLAHNYHLQGSSPAVDAGMTIADITDSSHGLAPDLGRYETP